MSGFYGLYWYFNDTGTGAQPTILESEQKSPVDYAREFERIYNFHTQKEPIRLF